MKQMKKLSRIQKIILTNLGLDCRKYSLVADNGSVFVIGLKENPNKQTYIKYIDSKRGKLISE